LIFTNHALILSLGEKQPYPASQAPQRRSSWGAWPRGGICTRRAWLESKCRQPNYQSLHTGMLARSCAGHQTPLYDCSNSFLEKNNKMNFNRYRKPSPNFLASRISTASRVYLRGSLRCPNRPSLCPCKHDWWPACGLDLPLHAWPSTTCMAKRLGVFVKLHSTT
jgi:hypothetical protein